jgi:lipid-binding SYLF domain-containing protein
MTTSPQQAMNALEGVLRRHFNEKEDEAALSAVMDVYAFIQTMQSSLGDNTSKETAPLAARALIAITIAWPQNPFIMRYGSQFMTTVGLCVGAALDGAEIRERAAVAKGKGDDDGAREQMFRASVCFNEIANVALAALSLQKGVGYARKNAVALRDAMWDLK